MIGDDDSMEGEENDPAVVQDDEEDIKAFLRHENGELAREVMDLIIALGGNAGKHWRQVRKKLKLLPNGVLPGLVLDLTTVDEEGKPWDFDIPSQRRKAEQLIRVLKPRLLVGSPVCSAFCAEQNVSDRTRTEEAKRKTQTRARAHLQFTMNLYKMQTEGGRYFLHEHPAYVSSWDEDSTRRIMGMKGAETVCAPNSVQEAGREDWEPTEEAHQVHIQREEDP